MPTLIWILTTGLFFSCFDKPLAEEEDDDQDNDRREGHQEGDCVDGIDNDEDGRIDCADLGCQDKPACSGAPDVDTDSGDMSCGGTAPEIEAVTCENSGVQEHPDYGELPTFSLYISATDEDADLTYYQLFVDIDSELDGEKATDAIPLNPVQGSLSDDICDVSEANVGLTIYMRSGPPEFSTTYEWYVQVSDALGIISEPYMIQCTTPNEDGTG